MKTQQTILVALVWTCLGAPLGWGAPLATTQPASNVTPLGATLNATVNPAGTSTKVYFRYGPTTNYGSVTVLTNIGAGAVALAVSNTLTGLIAGSSYHYRVVATNTTGASLGTDLVFNTPVFSLTNAGLPGLASSAVACGDFNNDGKLDLVRTGTDGAFNPRSEIWRNMGANSFSNISAAMPGLPALSSGSVVWGDVDNDGKQDFLITGFAGLDASHFPILTSQVWRNLGNGTFANLNAGLPGTDTGAAAFGDFDNDGNLDILLTGYGSGASIAQIWRNQGNGTFSNINVRLPGVFYSSVALGDFDNDGNVDISLSGTTNGFVSGALTQVWRNLGRNVFTNINAGLPGVSQGAVAWGDFDNDGRLDLLVTGYSSTGPVAQVWRNLGNGTFANTKAGLPGISQGAVAVGDYDNDGHLDLLLTGVDATTNLICQVWRNLGNGAFTNIGAALPGIRSGSAAWADFDNDGKLDILLTGFDATNNPVCRLYHNNTALRNTLQPLLTNSGELSNGNLQFSFRGKTGLGYVVWCLHESRAVESPASPRESSPGTFQFTDGAAPRAKARFYKTSSP